nr:MAG TPA: hypothetical protein [Caudoviricetes sp.]
MRVVMVFPSASVTRTSLGPPSGGLLSTAQPDSSRL